MSATTVYLSNSLFSNIYIFNFFLCRSRQCGTRSHPAGANPSGGSKENGGLQGKAKTASEKGQAQREHAPSPQGVNPALVMGCSGRYILPCPRPLCVPGACCYREVLSSFLRVATVSVNPAATSDFLLLAAASSPLGAFWGQR